MMSKNKLKDFNKTMKKYKRTQKRFMKYNLKVLNFCIYHLSRIHYPTNAKDANSMRRLLDLYDECVLHLNENVEFYRTVVEGE